MPIRSINDNEEFNYEQVDSFLKVGDKEYNIADAYIIGIFVENEYRKITWTIEVQIADDNLFEAFCDIIVPEGIAIKELSNQSIESEELLPLINYEGDLHYDLSDIISISFGDYEHETNQIPCTIEATLSDGNEYFLQAQLEFRGYYYFTNDKNSVKKFVEEYLGFEMEEVEIECEKHEDGYWLCIIF